MEEFDGNIAVDKDGYLKDLGDWSEAVATQLAHQESIELDEKHWEIITLLQNFYRQYEISPAMRPLVKYIAAQAGPEKGNSIYLLQLFPPSPARIASKIAGLPRPDNCL